MWIERKRERKARPQYVVEKTRFDVRVHTMYEIPPCLHIVPLILCGPRELEHYRRLFLPRNGLWCKSGFTFAN